MQDIKKDMQMIQELMQELQEKMECGPEDFDERLGKGKPEVQVMKIEGEMPMDGLDKDNEAVEAMGDAEMGDEMPMEDESPEEKLKKRLMKLKG